MRGKIVHVQTVLPEKNLTRLKISSGETTTKDALAKAVYFLICLSKTTTDEKVVNLIKRSEATEEGMKKVVDFLLNV